MTDPSASDLLAERRAKLERLRESGTNPFPYRFDDRTGSGTIRAAHAGLADGEETTVSYRVAGRIAARRGHGKAAFLDIVDGDGRLQLHARADVIGAESLDELTSLDLGDIIGVTGEVFRTRRGELSLKVTDWELLAKSLLPPPEKFHGLEDIETRYRRRELDLIANEEVRTIFRKRAKTITSVRRWLDERGFLEVETPVLQPLYGGALAKPFITHHNVLDRDLYLRIAPELYLKRLIVGGLEKVYELGKDFRNEGVSHKHNPEFTMIEWYEAYADYNDGADRLEQLVAYVVAEVNGEGSMTVTREIGEPGAEEEVEIDFTPPWRRIGLREAIIEYSGIDIAEHDRDSLAEAMGGKVDPQAGWGKLVDDLVGKTVEPNLVQPTFLVDYPVELSPFAKLHRDADPAVTAAGTPERPLARWQDGLTERWEAFVGGIEVANAFSELNDPDDQRRRFEQQAAEINRGDDEAQPYDETFIAALEQGMPPTSGVGLGIDRLVMMLTGARSLREVLLFPAMRD